MKKLLTIWSVITLTGTTGPNVVSCNKQNNEEVEDDTYGKDLEVLNEIKTKASQDISNYLKARMYIDSNKNNLEDIYKRVNLRNSSYQLNLNKSDDKKLTNYFINEFNNVFDYVNQNLKNTYSNYFPDKMPLTFEEDKTTIDVSFINVEGIKNNFPANIVAEDFKGARVNLKTVVSLNFKTMFSEFEISTVYNVTENPSALQTLSSEATKFLLKKLQRYFKDLENVDFSTNKVFKSLYEQVQWDFSKKIDVLNDTLKKSLKQYIIGNEKFRNIDVTYNNVALIERVSNGDLSEENKGSDKLFKTQNARDLTLSNWLKGTEEPKSINNATENDFVNFYKSRIGRGLNINDNDSLTLGSFKFNLSYLNIDGMGLSGYATNIDDVDDDMGNNIIMTLNLSRAAIDQKLNNWAKIIIAFWKHINTGPFAKKDTVEITVASRLFRTISEVNKRDGLKGTLKVLVDNFKKTTEAQSLEDIDLFKLISHPSFKKTKGKSKTDTSGSPTLIWDSSNSKNWAVLFTFGVDFDSGLYYCFASSSDDKSLKNDIDFKISIKKIVY
ncbi:hypothetical protein S100390_v1c04080 [Spiroplasma sp. NBRC 100390]|uniref:lipoprotein n=1 Tax=unclassified Spiroplasma TaxID=2637901 RepID=UPI000892841A|nr:MULTISPECIES: lipoprotein [unclassified Spiroplasma]AOX43751.1 hypothetical protein STU14_v1c04080 [Spiroplasma sp. TU-14]APE13221.1 hypothetical protein S100390_v1c04080 [Spiroplasma sp. NBRC 100390]